MKNLLKIGLMAITVGMLAPGCSGCGDRTKSAEEPGKVTLDSPKKSIDTTSVTIDTAKKDTSKK